MKMTAWSGYTPLQMVLLEGMIQQLFHNPEKISNDLPGQCCIFLSSKKNGNSE